MLQKYVRMRMLAASSFGNEVVDLPPTFTVERWARVTSTPRLNFKQETKLSGRSIRLKVGGRAGARSWSGSHAVLQVVVAESERVQFVSVGTSFFLFNFFLASSFLSLRLRHLYRSLRRRCRESVISEQVGSNRK